MGLGGSLGGSALGGALDGAGVHKFDTGLFRAQRTTLRQALADRIKLMLLPSLGGGAAGYLRMIGMLPRPLKDSSVEEIGFLLSFVTQGQSPAVLIALGKKDYDPAGMDFPSTHYRGGVEVVFYVVSTNARGPVEGRLFADVAGSASSQADPGIETILEHLEELLIGQDCDIKTLSELRPSSEDEVFTGAEESIWEQRYTMQVSREINADRLVTGLLTSIENKNNLDGADPANPIVDTITTLEVP
jgi:hypothetical protein